MGGLIMENDVKVEDPCFLSALQLGERCYEVRRLESDNLAAVIALQEYVIDHLTDKDMFLGRPHHILAQCLGACGVAVGAYFVGELIAFRMIYYPGEFNQGEYAGLPAAVWEHVAHVEVEAVHPQHRGNALQRRLAVPLLAAAGDLQGKRYLCSVVSPQNYPSIKDKLLLGLPVVRLVELPGNHWRYIFCRDRLNPAAFDSTAAVAVPVGDRQQQLGLLAQGYQGFQIEKAGDTSVIWFGVPR